MRLLQRTPEPSSNNKNLRGTHSSDKAPATGVPARAAQHACLYVSQQLAADAIKFALASVVPQLTEFESLCPQETPARLAGPEFATHGGLSICNTISQALRPASEL